MIKRNTTPPLNATINAWEKREEYIYFDIGEKRMHLLTSQTSDCIQININIKDIFTVVLMS